MIAASGGSAKLIIFAISLGLTLALQLSAQTATRAAIAARSQTNGTDKPDCGSMNQLIARVDRCARPLMDILAGRLDKWPRNEEDAMRLCDQFGYSERCIKETSRQCAKGIQKTIISTVGASVQRVRRRECTKGKFGDILKTTQCIEKNQKVVRNWMSGVTARLEAIESQQPRADKKIASVCCIINDIEKEMKATLDPFCPNEAKFIQRLFRGVVDNAVEIVCRQPKCNDYMKGLKVTKVDDFKGIISVILKIVFSLDLPE